MKRGWIVGVTVLLAVALASAPATVFAADNAANDKIGAGKSNNAFLYLYEKDADYNFVWDGA